MSSLNTLEGPHGIQVDRFGDDRRVVHSKAANHLVRHLFGRI